MKLKELSPEAGAQFICKVTRQRISTENYAQRIKQMGLTPVGNVHEWAKYGIAAAGAGFSSRARN
jgi:hypothetical protein